MSYLRNSCGIKNVHRLVFIFLVSASTVSAQQIAYVTDKNTVYTSINGEDTVHSLRNISEGDWIVYYDSTRKQVAFTMTFLGNKRSDFKSWYRNGGPKEFRLNNDCEPYYESDLYTWFRNGQKKLEAFSRPDSSFGRNWWRNGQLAYERKLWSGKGCDHDVGMMNWFHPNGVLYRRDSFYTDSTVIRSFNELGGVSSIAVYLPDTAAPYGSSCHYMHSFHTNDKESSTALYPHSGRQPITYFYPSGIKKAQCDWMEGNIGPYKEWYENGQLKAEGNYSMGIKKFTHVTSVNYYPTKTGHWIYYNEAGWKEKEEWRELGGSVVVKEYNAKGEVTKEDKFKETIPPEVTFPEEYQK